jgi:hypothetical protein
MNENKFNLLFTLFFILFIFLIFGVIMYLVMIGNCMEIGKQSFGIKYDDSFFVCLKNIGAFK